MDENGEAKNRNHSRNLLRRGCLYKRKDTGRYYLKIRWPGADKAEHIPLVASKSGKATKSKTAALKVARRMLRHRLRDASDLPAPPANIEALATRYARAHPGEQGKFVANVARKLASIAQVGTAHELTPTAIRTYAERLVEQNRAPATRANHLAALSAFCRFLMTTDRRGQPLLASNPVQHVQRPKLFRPGPRALSDEIREELLRRAREAGEELPVALAMHTGMRLSELMNLRWSDIGTAITVGSEDYAPKGKRSRRIPINSALRAVLDGCAQGDGYVLRQQSKMEWLRLMRRLSAGLPGFGPGKLWHALRRDVATRLARQGVDPYRLMRAMGWEDLRTAQRYIEAVQDPDVPEFEGL